MPIILSDVSKPSLLGGEIGKLFGRTHPSSDAGFNQVYFDQILENQTEILAAISAVGRAVLSWADILTLLPYKTVEIDEQLRANTLFIQSQGLLQALGDAIAKGASPEDTAYKDTFIKYVEAIDHATARYLAAIGTIGQPHDICVAVRPLWNAIQSIKDAGKICNASTPGYDDLLKTHALRVREIADSIISKMHPKTAVPFGFFRDRYDESHRAVSKARNDLIAHDLVEARGHHFYEFPSLDDSFFSGSGDDVRTGNVVLITSKPETKYLGGQWGPDGELISIKTVVDHRTTSDARVSRVPFSNRHGMKGPFKIILDPHKEDSRISSFIDSMNIASAQFYHYFEVFVLLEAVSREIDDSLVSW